MTEYTSDWLAAEFEANRTHLQSVAYRMLGSRTEADDAVQEAWLRLSRTDATIIDNLGGWLTTVVARVCLDMLRSRDSRREESIDAVEIAHDAARADHDAIVADSVGLALLVVLSTLTPGERVAFVLHDMFDLPFEEIAPIVGRSLDATRQLASRARRRVRGGSSEEEVASSSSEAITRRRAVVDAFLAASRDGDFERLLAILDPDVVVRADAAAMALGAFQSKAGAKAVAETFAGRARGAKPALVGGNPGLVWAPGGTPRVAFRFVVADERIMEIELIADSERLTSADFIRYE